MTAKYWGKGPRLWTPQVIRFKSMGAAQLPEGSSPASQHSNHGGHDFDIMPPNDECHWTIHHRESITSEEIPTEDFEDDPDRDYDVEDESTWPSWPASNVQPSFEETIQEGLTGNSFSLLDQSDLPVPIELIARQPGKSNIQRKVEALGFAIVARNYDIVRELLQDAPYDLRIAIARIQPYHLAATYLDGSRQCCLIMHSLYTSLGDCTESLNDLGLTVMDMYFITILRSHTRLTPAAVSQAFKGSARFPGEEVDICGRWDADSSCIRQLLGRGSHRIPSQWKHTFCHSSAQTICHSMAALFGRHDPMSIDEESGLFSKVCLQCGQKDTLPPLHVIVRVAFHLCRDGFEGETLFGILAVLVGFFVMGGNPFLRANLYVPSHDSPESGMCDHKKISPIEYATRLSKDFGVQIKEEALLGWKVFTAVLEYRCATWEARWSEYVGSVDDVSDDCDEKYRSAWYWDHAYDFSDKELSLLWSAILTELTTYRKLSKEDACISSSFNMEGLLNGLESGNGPVQIELIEKNMMKLNKSGFLEVHDGHCPTVSEVGTSYFANVEKWERIRFISMPELGQ
jgi:hypothetical protein